MSAGAGVSAVVPTLGASPLLEDCLAALRADGGEELELVVVAQRDAAALRRRIDAAGVRVDRWVPGAPGLGFAGGTDRGLAAARGEWLATVNDDAVVRPGWLAALRAALAAAPGAAAAQGVNLQAGRPERVDGCGLAWNRWWQAVQLGRGGAPPPGDAPPREVFGVSATAALYRRAALAAVALSGGAVFDPRLVSWYEDADLAVRLRAAGWTALSVPAATALHAGGATGGGTVDRYRLLYGNRWRVTARLLGRRWILAEPRIVGRDLADLGRALARGHGALAAGIVAGWARAARHLARDLHLGPPAVAAAELARLAAERWGDGPR